MRLLSNDRLWSGLFCFLSVLALAPSSVSAQRYERYPSIPQRQSNTRAPKISVYPIGFPRQDDAAAGLGIEKSPQDAVPPTGQILPGLGGDRELALPELASPQLEALPQSRESSVGHGHDGNGHDIANYPISWVGLNNRAPARKPATEDGGIGRDRLPLAPMNRAYRRPSPPPPVINPFQPAIVHVPVHIQVVPTFVEVYPGWGWDPIYGPTSPGYFGRPSLAPSPREPGSPYAAPELPSTTAPGPISDVNPRFHSPTDQPMFRMADVNLVGRQSNSTDFVSYPFNFHSYPSRPTYGVYFQTFPVSRRLP